MGWCGQRDTENTSSVLHVWISGHAGGIQRGMTSDNFCISQEPRVGAGGAGLQRQILKTWVQALTEGVARVRMWMRKSRGVRMAL